MRENSKFPKLQHEDVAGKIKMDLELAKRIILHFNTSNAQEYVEGEKHQFLLDATEAMKVKLTEIFKREVLNLTKSGSGAYNIYQSLEICYCPKLKSFKSRHSVFPNSIRKKGDFYYLEIKLTPFLADLPYLEAQWRRLFIAEEDPDAGDFERYEWNDKQLIQTLDIEQEISQLQAYFDSKGFEVIPSSFLDQEWEGMPRQFCSPLLDEFSRDPASYRDYFMPGLNPDN